MKPVIANQPPEVRVPLAKGAPAKAVVNNDIFTSAAVTSLLRSELADSPAAEEPNPERQPVEGEVQPGEEAAAGSELTPSAEQGAEGVEAGEADETPAAGAEAEPGGEVEVAAPPELPAELQAAVDQWEEQGGGELPPVLQSLVEKRIGKLTAQREEARAGQATEKSARETAEARVQELESQLAAGGANGPAAGPAMDDASLARLERAAKSLVDDAENFLDDTATDAERERVEKYLESERLDAKGLKRRVRELREFLTTIPQQRQSLAAFKQQEQAIEPKAREWFPFLYDKTKPEYAEAQKIQALMPELQHRIPGHRLAVGIYMLGLQAFKRLHPDVAPVNGKPPVAKPAVKVVVKAPVKTPTAGAAAPAVRGNGRERQEQQARSEFEKNPTREAAANLLKIGLRS